MAHDFLGTFNATQWKRLAEFARKQLSDVDARILHLLAEQDRIGVLSFNYSDPTKFPYSAQPKGSYIDKLLSAYQVVGGDPMYDLQVRQKNTQALFLVRADEGRKASVLSNGQVVGSEGLADGPSALLVQKLTNWMSEATEYKREALERKVRRAVDYADQLADEIALLQVVKQGKEVDNSVENIIAQVEEMIRDHNYRAIADDKGRDPHGLMAYAPYAGLEPGPKRQGNEYSRTGAGYTTPEGDNQS